VSKPAQRKPGLGGPKPQGAPAPGARAAALARLLRLAESYPDLPLGEARYPGLSPRDAALAHAIVDAAVRRWITLEAIVQSRLDRPFIEVDAPVRAALLGGAAQMLFLDKVPPHAAIFETVEWVKSHQANAGGFVNGVLRAVSRLLYGVSTDAMPAKTRRDAWTDQRDEVPLASGGALALHAAILPSDLHQRWAIATSHPTALVKRWAGGLGETATRDLLQHNLIDDPPTTMNVAHAAADLPAACKPHDVPGCRVWGGSREDLAAILAARTDVWVQDAASTLAVRDAAGLSPSLVIDLCAGRGTKTRQLAATFPHAEIIASDPDSLRSTDLRGVAASCGRVRIVPPAALREQFAGRADLVLADVPCTNTGVLPRRCEARYRWSRDQLDRLIALQRTIIADAAVLLAPGGTLVYATCSIEREENEDQVAWAAGLGFSARTVRRTMPVGMPGGPEARYHDGAFSAVMDRGGGG